MIEFRGANFSWGSRAWAGKPDLLPQDAAPRLSQEDAARRGRSAVTAAPAAGGGQAAANRNGAAPAAAPVTLHALRFRVEPGQFLGIAGEVGSGKSSLLAALLGELQPVPQPGYHVGEAIQGAPVMAGRVAFCQQVPWIEAGSVRENITFGSPFDPTWCAPVLTTAAMHFPHGTAVITHTGSPPARQPTCELVCVHAVARLEEVSCPSPL